MAVSGGWRLSAEVAGAERGSEGGPLHRADEQRRPGRGLAVPNGPQTTESLHLHRRIRTDYGDPPESLNLAP